MDAELVDSGACGTCGAAAVVALTGRRLQTRPELLCEGCADRMLINVATVLALRFKCLDAVDQFEREDNVRRVPKSPGRPGKRIKVKRRA